MSYNVSHIEPGQILDEYIVKTGEHLARYIVLEIIKVGNSDVVKACCIYDAENIDAPGSITTLTQYSLIGSYSVYWEIDGKRIFA
tara:strand:- start:4734 stop:4988 length:255 start_codon:yes stop_codon:yes gene_type:complete